MSDGRIDPQQITTDMAAASVDLLISALRDFEAYEEELPHVVVCTDVRSGDMSISGPFSTRAAGQRVIEHEKACAGTDSTLTFTLVPLYPALQLGDDEEITTPEDPAT